MLAILASSAAVCADRSPVSSQNTPTPSAGTVTRNNPTVHSCLVIGSEMAEGQSLVQAGRLVEGRAKFQSALETVERNGIPDPITRACLMNLIGFVELEGRHWELAARWFQRGLELKPPSEALLVVLIGNLASAYSYLDQLDRAEELARRAIDLSVRIFGPDHPETWFPRTTLAFVHVARGDFASAEPVLRRVLYLAERNPDTSSYELAAAAANLGFIHFVNRRYSLAQQLLQKSIAGFEEDPIRATDEIPLTQALLAVSYAAVGQHRDANMWLEQALANDLSPEDPSLATVLERGATTRFLLKDYESGRQLYDRAITVLESCYGPMSQEVHDALERYSALLRSAKNKTRGGQLKAQRKEISTRLKEFTPKR